MHPIKRWLIVMKPKQPFLDWIMSVDDDPEFHPTLADTRKDCRAFLIPEFVYLEEADELIQRIAPDLFEIELYAWYTDKDCWPKNRNYKMFQEWFDVEVHSQVIDLLQEKIEEGNDDGARY